MNHRSVGSYARELRPLLPVDAFAPARSRLLLLPVHALIVSAATFAIGQGHLEWPFRLVLSLVLGASFAGLTFVGHELLHGGIVHGKRVRHAIGWFCFLPFVLSPRLWIAWHNGIHHGNTGRPGADPDAYPTLAEYERSLRVRVATDHFSLGRQHWAGALTLLIGFSVQSGQMLFAARALKMSNRDRRLAIAETLLAIAVWSVVGLLVGPSAFVFVFFLPLLVANGIVMAFIITNHSLSPLTEINDPLANSLSVTTPRWIEWLTLGFGFHVEHHLFPAMSSRSAPAVRELIRARWPERYQSMPLLGALRTIARTGRVYKDNETLIDPNTGYEWPALAPTGTDRDSASWARRRDLAPAARRGCAELVVR